MQNQQLAVSRQHATAVRPNHAAGHASHYPAQHTHRHKQQHVKSANISLYSAITVLTSQICNQLSCCSIPESTQATATFLAKADGVLAGLAVANMVCEMVDPSLNITWSLQGDQMLQQLHTY